MTIKTKEEIKNEFLSKAKKRLQRAIESDSDNRKEALNDIQFCLPGANQWDEVELQKRNAEGRPSLSINLLPAFKDQLIGEQRHNKIKIKVKPVDSKGDINLANIREGIIYNIEYLSNAEGIQDQAFDMAVTCGYGAWRYLTRYTKENPFIQEIYMEPINNPFEVYFDPSSKSVNYEDAKYCFIIDKMPKSEFEDKYKDYNIPTSAVLDTLGASGLSDEYWCDDETVTVAEYFIKEEIKKKLCLMSDGSILEKEEALQKISENEDLRQTQQSLIMEAQMNSQINAPLDEMGNPIQIQSPNVPMIPSLSIDKEREVEEYKIAHYIISGNDIISEYKIEDGEVIPEKYFPGCYIPIVMLHGKIIYKDGKKMIYGLIRNAKTAQKEFNFWHTCAAETIALAPLAPWQATATQIKGHEKQYAESNRRLTPVLLYNHDPNAATPIPTRIQPVSPPIGIFSEVQNARDNIKSAIGMFNADVGDEGRELSGVAITARQKPGDVSTYIFFDNLKKAVEYSGKILVEMIPFIYDTERDARLQNIDDSEQFTPINTPVGGIINQVMQNPKQYSGIDIDRLKKQYQKEGPNSIYNDISIGKYDVRVSTGPSYTTQRLEAADNFMKFATVSNAMNPVDKYFTVKNLDFPGADEYSEVLKRMLPSGLIEPKPGDKPLPPPPLPPPPSPDVVAEAQKDNAYAQLALLRAEVEKIKIQTELIKYAKELSDTKNEEDNKIKNVVLDILQKLHSAPGTHPADANLGISPLQVPFIPLRR